MKQTKSYLKNAFESPVAAIVKGIDQDVELGEDILMLGLGIVMMSSFFAPIAPPRVLLPLVALTFVISSTFANRHYQNMEQKLLLSMQELEGHQTALLKPIATVFKEHPADVLVNSYNILKNWKRTVKSCLGGLLINPFWMPIFYVMGIQINADKNLAVLNKAIMRVEQRIMPPKPIE
ncbi:MAG: hypothetical protein HOP02_01265 [Methylococcaceae bacterium]|nr:hypothetical protein [Methylococcaceae bacterium]